MNFVFYVIVVLALAALSIVAYPILRDAARELCGDLKDYYDKYDDEDYKEE